MALEWCSGLVDDVGRKVVEPVTQRDRANSAGLVTAIADAPTWATSASRSLLWDVGPWSLARVLGQPVDVGRSQTKDEWLVAAADEFDRLWQVVSTVSDAGRTRPGAACAVWSS
jgi:hypothetical protein